MLGCLRTSKMLTIDYLENNKVTIDNVSLKDRKNIKILFIDDEGFVLNPKNVVLVAIELASWSANNDLPTFGLATKQYNSLDFIRLSTMKSFFMKLFLISVIVFIRSSPF